VISAPLYTACLSSKLGRTGTKIEAIEIKMSKIKGSLSLTILEFIFCDLVTNNSKLYA
jgi:hypothetical protein